MFPPDEPRELAARLIPKPACRHGRRFPCHPAFRIACVVVGASLAQGACTGAVGGGAGAGMRGTVGAATAAAPGGGGSSSAGSGAGGGGASSGAGVADTGSTASPPTSSGPGGNGNGNGMPDPGVVAGGMTGQPGASSAPIATPTIARLSEAQWANSVRDLLLLPNPGDLTLPTADAVVRLDNEADALFVNQPLHDDLQAAAERLATTVASDPIAIARLVPSNAPTDTAGKGQAFI